MTEDVRDGSRAGLSAGEAEAVRAFGEAWPDSGVTFQLLFARLAADSIARHAASRR